MCIKISVDSKKNPYDRIKEDLHSACHISLKQEVAKSSSITMVQPTLMAMQVRQRDKEKEGHSAIHSFVEAISKAGLSLHVADGPLGKCVKKCCPATKTMPEYATLQEKYLPEVF